MRSASYPDSVLLVIPFIMLGLFLSTPVLANKTVKVDRARLSLFQPLPKSAEIPGSPRSEALISLGRKLYFDTRLSKNHDLSCNSCHPLDQYGADSKPTSPGHKNQLGSRNSPTVYNSALQFSQFWDGRSPNVEEQAKGPILNPVEMAMPSEERVVEVLKSVPGYKRLFRKAFKEQPEPITYDNMARAIGAFERGLMTPGKWDKFLQGNDKALSNSEKRGLNLFLDKNCHSCHGGAGLGGQMFQKLGLLKPYPSKDQGRYEVTKVETDKMFFKVPLLRNIEKTGPYFHDGSVETLERTIKIMADYQYGLGVTEEEITDIVAFLKSLTGPLPTKYIAKPKLPVSGPLTPKPDPK